jgi:hypothetical protein
MSPTAQEEVDEEDQQEQPMAWAAANFHRSRSSLTMMGDQLLGGMIATEIKVGFREEVRDILGESPLTTNVMIVLVFILATYYASFIHTKF